MDENIVNNSGQGKGIDIPAEVKRFNWGAFFFQWVWGLFNKSYLTLISLGLSVLLFVIGFLLVIFAGASGKQEIVGLTFILMFFLNVISTIVSLALSIWFGIKGNDWAWQNKKWESVQYFHHVQRIWAIVGTVLVFLGIPLIILAMTLPSLLMNTDKVKNRTAIIKSVSLVQQASLMNEALDKKCELSSEGLASCFGETLSKPVNGNKIEDEYSGSVIEFKGDGYCAGSNACYVTIISGNAKEKAGLYLDAKGSVRVNSDDLSKVMNKYSSGK